MTARIFCAIDTKNFDEAGILVKKLKSVVYGFKLGLEFFTAHGPMGIDKIRTHIGDDARIFLDLKLHDIPHTVARAVQSAIQCNPKFLTLHASGGKAMMQAAAEVTSAAQANGLPAPKLLAVTVLTHLDADDLCSIGQPSNTQGQVLRLARLALDSGMQGIVCSPHEIGMLRRELPSSFILMVPGVRLAGSAQDDQKRIMTPQEAAKLGADYLVIGRPITQAADPAAMARSIIL